MLCIVPFCWLYMHLYVWVFSPLWVCPKICECVLLLHCHSLHVLMLLHSPSFSTTFCIWQLKHKPLPSRLLIPNLSTWWCGKWKNVYTAQDYYRESHLLATILFVRENVAQWTKLSFFPQSFSSNRTLNVIYGCHMNKATTIRWPYHIPVFSTKKTNLTPVFL